MHKIDCSVLAQRALHKLHGNALPTLYKEDRVLLIQNGLEIAEMRTSFVNVWAGPLRRGVEEGVFPQGPL